MKASSRRQHTTAERPYSTHLLCSSTLPLQYSYFHGGGQRHRGSLLIKCQLAMAQKIVVDKSGRDDKIYNDGQRISFLVHDRRLHESTELFLKIRRHCFPSEDTQYMKHINLMNKNAHCTFYKFQRLLRCQINQNHSQILQTLSNLGLCDRCCNNLGSEEVDLYPRIINKQFTSETVNRSLEHNMLPVRYMAFTFRLISIS